MTRPPTQQGQALLEFVIVFPLLLLLTLVCLEMIRLAVFKVTLETLAQELAAEGAALEIVRGLGAEPSEKEVESTQEPLERLLATLPFLPAETHELSFRKRRISTLMGASWEKGEEGARGLEVRLSACLPFFAATLADAGMPPHELAREAQAQRGCFGRFRTTESGFSWRYFVIKAKAWAPRHAAAELFERGLVSPPTVAGLTPAIPDLVVGGEKLQDNAYLRMERALENQEGLERALDEVLHEPR